jgi:hypothetical protein
MSVAATRMESINTPLSATVLVVTSVLPFSALYALMNVL